MRHTVSHRKVSTGAIGRMAHGRPGAAARMARCQRGVALLEAIVAIAIILSVTLAVAFTFSTGKVNLERLGWRRAVLAQAQLRLETLLHNPAVADTTFPAGGVIALDSTNAN